jgi:hypothetical protein
MYRYQVFGLCIHSDIELSGFAPGCGDPDLVIQQDELVLSPEPRPQLRGDVVSGRVIDEGQDLDLLFYLSGGERALVYSLRPIKEDLLRSFVQGPLLAGALRQRHLLVLHGSAVSDGERVVVFLGNSGWGKSTLATYFHSCGYELVSDDIVVVHPGTDVEPAMAPPGIKQVRLRPTAAARLVADYESLPFVTGVTSKRLQVLEGEEVRPLPVQKIYVLQKHTAEVNRITPLASHLVPMHFVAHTHATNWITAPGYVSEHLKRCAQLARHTPVGLLERRLSLSELPAIYDLVQDDLEAERKEIEALDGDNHIFPR